MISPLITPGNAGATLTRVIDLSALLPQPEIVLTFNALDTLLTNPDKNLTVMLVESAAADTNTTFKGKVHLYVTALPLATGGML